MDKSEQSREGVTGHNLVHGYFHSEGIGYCTQQVGDVHSGDQPTVAMVYVILPQLESLGEIE